MLILKCEKAVLGVYRASKAAWHYKCQYIASAAESVFSSKFAGFNYICFIWSHNSRLIQVFDDEMQKMKVTLHYITIAVSLNALDVTSALRNLINHRSQVYFYGWTDTVLFASWLVTTSIPSEYQPEVAATGDQLKGIVTLDKIQDLAGGGFEH